MGLIDFPDKRKLHKKPTPTIGGLIFFIIFTEHSIIHFTMNQKNLDFSLYFICFAMFIVGLFDDIKKLKAISRLILILVIFFIFFNFAPEFAVYDLNLISFDTKIELNSLSIFFSVLCMALFINAMNMTDGLNGIFLGTSIIVLLVIFISYKHYIEVSFIPFVILFLLILLILNLKDFFFMGDSGVYIISTLMGIMIIQAYNSELSNIKSVEQIFLILMIPGIDMLRLFINRILSKKNPFMPDNNHLHHLLRNKMNATKTLVVYLTLILTSSLASFLDMIDLDFIILCILTIYLFLIFYLTKKSNFVIDDK